jgi:hypothetical protein
MLRWFHIKMRRGQEEMIERWGEDVTRRGKIVWEVMGLDLVFKAMVREIELWEGFEIYEVGRGSLKNFCSGGFEKYVSIVLCKFSDRVELGYS